MKWSATLLIGAALLAGCAREPGSRVFTKGNLSIQVDEAIVPVVTLVVDDFQRQYPEAKIGIHVVQGREAVANFANDSIRIIIAGREFNKEEKDALASAKIEYQEYRVALSAVAVIANKGNRDSTLRVGEVDSMFAGIVTRWHGKRVIDLAIGNVNSSANEVFRSLVLKGAPFALSATPFTSSSDLIDYVRKTPGRLGIVNLAWLKGVADELSIIALGTPGVSPDSTEPPGKYYSPAQAYVYQNYYPVTAPIFIYSRDYVSDLATGFIAYVTSPPGQRMFLNGGVVPQTQPVRLVQLTSTR
jgi:ABC-type phosphate transport system substrate-binding protein